MTIMEMKRRALKLLKEKWVLAIVVCLVLFGLSFIWQYVRSHFGLVTYYESILATVFISLLTGMFFGPFNLAEASFFLKMSRGVDVDFNDYLDGYKMWQKGFMSGLLVGLYTLLWTFLLIIPGIIKAIAYSQTQRILAENPQLEVSEAIKHSIRIMDGNKWRYFVFNLSFIGWGIIVYFTRGFGNILLNPYVAQANAVFYHDLVKGDAVLGHSINHESA